MSLPERHYELAGRLFARAIVDAEQGRPVAEALRTAARDAGRGLGREARERAGTRPGRAALLAAGTDALAGCGYEPRADESGIALVNCPFHALAQEYTDLVCGMNLELLQGFVDGLERVRLEARLEPAAGRCCVRLAAAKEDRQR